LTEEGVRGKSQTGIEVVQVLKIQNQSTHATFLKNKPRKRVYNER
jgi:hypothetical protein